MAEWTAILKNNSGSSVTVDDLGLVIANATQIDAHLQFMYGELTNSDDLKTLLTAGTLVLNDGTADLNTTDSVDYLTRVHKEFLSDNHYTKTESDVITDAIGTDVTGLQTEVDAIETGVGLHTDGTYIQPTGTNYLNSTTTVMGADVALDTQAKTTADGLAQEITDRGTADALKVDKAGDTMTGDLVMGANAVTSTADPSGPNDLPRWGYVETQITAAAAGLDPKASCKAAQTVALPACTYDNGTSGVGATLTADAVGVLPDQDGVTLAANDSLLVWKQTNAAHNGIYELTTVGTSGVAFIFTRREDFDGNPAAEIDGGEHTFITEGTSQQGYEFVTVGISAAVTVGTDDIDFDVHAGSAGLVALQGEVDAIETGAGLDTDGTYITPTGTNYLNSTTDLADADVALDTQVDINETAISTETTARQTADSNLQTEIDAIENGVGLHTDGTYIQPTGTNYLNSTTDLMEADVALDTQVKTNADDIATLQSGNLDDLNVVDGVVYGKDTTRVKWMGPRLNYTYGRKGVTKNQFLYMSGAIPSNMAGYRIHRAMTITSLSGQLDTSGSCVLEVRKNDSPTVITSLTISSATGAHTDTVNIDLVAGDFIQVYCNNSVGVNDPTLNVTVAYNGGAVV